MSFFRPEALGALRRWGLPVGLALLGAALAWTWVPRLIAGDWFALLPLVFAALALIGAAGAAQTAIAGLWARFGGPGVVTIEEGRISYFGPLGGAILARDALATIDIVAGPDIPGGRAWHITDDFGQSVTIPAGATGAARLPDTLGTLAGFDSLGALAAMERATDGRYPIWQRPDDSMGRIDQFSGNS